MLILTRSAGERIFIDANGEKLILTLFEVSNGKVKIGFQASKETIIDREEVFNRKKDAVKLNNANNKELTNA